MAGLKKGGGNKYGWQIENVHYGEMKRKKIIMAAKNRGHSVQFLYSFYI